MLKMYKGIRTLQWYTDTTSPLFGEQFQNLERTIKMPGHLTQK